MKYLAILKDSWVESLDRKSLIVMVVISGLFILSLGGFSYSAVDPTDALRDMAKSFATVTLVRGGAVDPTKYPVTYAVDGVKKLGADEGKFADGYAFTLTVSPIGAFHRNVRHWDAINRGLLRKVGDKVPDLDAPADEELEIKFFTERYFDRAMLRRDVKRTAADGDRRVYSVKVKPSGAHTIDGAYKLGILYGLWSRPLEISVATWLFSVQKVLAQFFAGFFGVMIALFITAGSVPSMLQKGFIDVLISKPLNRPTLLAYKYVGGLTYAAITSAVFIGGSWLALSIRAGVWNWGYLATAGTLVLFFGVLYSIGVLMSVLTRSVVAAIVVPLLAWLVAFAINRVVVAHRNPIIGWDWMPEPGLKGLEAAAWLLPRPGDIDAANDYFIRRGAFGGEFVDAATDQAVAWVPLLGSSFLFIGVMLSLACWLFSRKDY